MSSNFDNAAFKYVRNMTDLDTGIEWELWEDRKGRRIHFKRVATREPREGSGRE